MLSHHSPSQQSSGDSLTNQTTVSQYLAQHQPLFTNNLFHPIPFHAIGNLYLIDIVPWADFNSVVVSGKGCKYLGSRVQDLYHGLVIAYQRTLSPDNIISSVRTFQRWIMPVLLIAEQYARTSELITRDEILRLAPAGDAHVGQYHTISVHTQGREKPNKPTLIAGKFLSGLDVHTWEQESNMKRRGENQPLDGVLYRALRDLGQVMHIAACSHGFIQSQDCVIVCRFRSGADGGRNVEMVAVHSISEPEAIMNLPLSYYTLIVQTLKAA